MGRLYERARPGTLAIFKLDITPFSPSEDQACPWTWECYAAEHSSPDGAYCAGGSGTTWEQAWARGRTHAELAHRARF